MIGSGDALEVLRLKISRYMYGVVHCVIALESTINALKIKRARVHSPCGVYSLCDVMGAMGMSACMCVCVERLWAGSGVVGGGQGVS